MKSDKDIVLLLLLYLFICLFIHLSGNSFEGVSNVYDIKYRSVGFIGLNILSPHQYLQIILIRRQAYSFSIQETLIRPGGVFSPLPFLLSSQKEEYICSAAMSDFFSGHDSLSVFAH